MKRTTITLFLVVLIGFFSQSWTSTADSGYFELIKGELLLLEESNEYLSAEFTVKTKNGKINVPVVSIDIKLKNGNVVSVNHFEFNEVNKRYSDYLVDLSPYKINVGDDFFMSITLDISEVPVNEPIIIDGGDVVDGGPGSGPNETILIIKFP